MRNWDFRGTINSASPSSFIGAHTADVNVTATNTGLDSADFAVKVASKPSGWIVDNGAIPAGDFVRLNVPAGQTKVFTFKVLPPDTGGSGTIGWEMWKVSGIWPITNFDNPVLDTESQSVSALGKPGAFSLTAPAANATGVSTTPLLQWGTASGATNYRVEMTGDFLGSPNPVHCKDVDLGTVLSWTYDGNPALTPLSVVWWHVIASNAAGTTEDTGGWRKFTLADDVPPTRPGTPYIDTAYDTGRYNNDRITGVDRPLFRWARSSDAHSTVAGYRLSYVDPTPDEDDYWTLADSWEPEVPLAQGQGTFYVCAVDSAGNVSEVSQCSFIIDRSAPAPPYFASPGEGVTISDTVPMLSRIGTPVSGQRRAPWM